MTSWTERTPTPDVIDGGDIHGTSVSVAYWLPGALEVPAPADVPQLPDGAGGAGADGGAFTGPAGGALSRAGARVALARVVPSLSRSAAGETSASAGWSGGPAPSLSLPTRAGRGASSHAGSCGSGSSPDVHGGSSHGSEPARGRGVIDGSTVGAPSGAAASSSTPASTGVLTGSSSGTAGGVDGGTSVPVVPSSAGTGSVVPSVVVPSVTVPSLVASSAVAPPALVAPASVSSSPVPASLSPFAASSVSGRSPSSLSA
jgi:hypothetical protein